MKRFFTQFTKKKFRNNEMLLFSSFVESEQKKTCVGLLLFVIKMGCFRITGRFEMKWTVTKENEN